MYFVFCLVDVIKLTKENTVSYESKKYNRWYVYVLLLLVIFLIPQPIFSETVKNNIFQAYKIPADSMKPTLLIGDRIFVKTDFASKSNVKRFDLIVFPFTQNPSKDFVKRIIAVEGETIEIKNKKILINDIPIKETYGIHTDSRIIPKRDNMNSIKVPEGSLFVMGDNRDNSHDSRFWGFVKASDVIGKVYSVYWSWDKEKNEVRWNRIGQIIK
ncbi:MAG: signal peptidase I [Desulfobacterales bacterium]|nr:signal peptidase I [Desulfobacterales bacterium]